MKKLTALAFVVFGLPVWWWSFWKISASFGHPIDPAVTTTLVVCELYARPFAACFIGWFVIDLVTSGIRNHRLGKVQRELSPARPGYGIADYGVPHCRYEPLVGGGFKVILKNSSWGRLGCGLNFLLFLIAPVLGGMYYFSGVTTGFLVILTTGSVLLYLLWKRVPSQIEVTRDTITIDGTPLERSHFNNFHVHGRTQLGYQYGLRNYGLAGEWTTLEVTEIASALNAHLMIAPPAGAQDRPSGEDLRNKRPNKY